MESGKERRGGIMGRATTAQSAVVARRSNERVNRHVFYFYSLGGDCVGGILFTQ